MVKLPPWFFVVCCGAALAFGGGLESLLSMFGQGNRVSSSVKYPGSPLFCVPGISWSRPLSEAAAEGVAHLPRCGKTYGGVRPGRVYFDAHQSLCTKPLKFIVSRRSVTRSFSLLQAHSPSTLLYPHITAAAPASIAA